MLVGIEVYAHGSWHRLIKPDGNLQLVKSNAMLSIAEYNLTRSTSFKVSCAANVGIFGDTPIRQAYGYDARQRYVAALVFGGGRVAGELMVLDVSDDDVNCVFVVDDVPMQRLAAVRWADIAGGYATSIVRGDDAPGGGLFSVCKYNNNADVHLPSIGLADMSSAMTRVSGVSVDLPPSLFGLRVLLNKAAYPTSYHDRWRREGPLYNYTSALFQAGSAAVVLGGQSFTLNGFVTAYGSVALQFVDVPEDYRLIIVDDNGDGVIVGGNQSLANRLVQVDSRATTLQRQGNVFGFVKVVAGAFTPLSSSDTFDLLVNVKVLSSVNVEWPLARIYLADVLPSATPFELLKWLALSSGCYMKSVGERVIVEPIALAGDVLYLERCEISGTMSRVYDGWRAQRNVVKYAEVVEQLQPATTVYNVDNDTLEVEVEVGSAPFGVGGESAGALWLPDIEVGEDNTLTIKSKAATIARQVGNELLYVEPVASEVVQLLCKQSTTLQLKGYLALDKWQALNEQRAIIYDGARWCWRKVVYDVASGKVDMTLQRLSD